MPDFGTTIMNLRCPHCLQREVDVVLRRDHDGEYWCPKCSYTGTQDEVRVVYEQVRARYRLRNTRLPLETQLRM